MTPERQQRLLTVLNRRQPDLTVIADKTHKPRNLAALVRNCDAVGIPKMHIVRPDDEGYQRFRGTTKGSDRWVETVQHDNLTDALTTVRGQGMKIYAAHLSETAVDFRDVDYTVPCAILMGNEKAGISEQAAREADQHIIIPMMGMVESFNVSTAAGIILVEAQRQRQLAGLYERKGTSDEVIAQYLFESRYQRLAHLCQSAGLAYPEYDLEGELIDPTACHDLLAKARG